MVHTVYKSKEKDIEPLFDMISMCITGAYKLYDLDDTTVKLIITDDINYVKKTSEYIAYVHYDKEVVDIKYGFDVLVEYNQETHRIRFIFGEYTKYINQKVAWCIPYTKYATVFDYGREFMVEEYECWTARPVTKSDKIFSWIFTVVFIIILVICFILGIFGGWIVMIILIGIYIWQFHRVSVGLNSYKDAFYKSWLFPFTMFNSCMPKM